MPLFDAGTTELGGAPAQPTSGIPYVLGDRLRLLFIDALTGSGSTTTWKDSIQYTTLTPANVGGGASNAPSATTTPSAFAAVSFGADSGALDSDILGSNAIAYDNTPYLMFGGNVYVPASGTADIWWAYNGGLNFFRAQVASGVIKTVVGMTTDLNSGAISTDAWHSVIFLWRYDSSIVELYVDGVLVDSKGFSAGPNWTQLAFGGINETNNATAAFKMQAMFLGAKLGAEFTSSDVAAVNTVLASYIVDHNKTASFSDTAAVTDSITASLVYSQTLSDTATVTDSLTQTATFGPTLSDAADVTDSITTALVYSQTLSDTSVLTDALVQAPSFLYAQTFSDTVSVSDTVGREIGRAFSDSVYADDEPINPATDIVPTLWQQGSYSGVPWTGTSPANGVSFNTGLVNAVGGSFSTPTVGAAVNGYTPLDADGTTQALFANTFVDQVLGTTAYAGWAYVNVRAITTNSTTPSANDAIIGSDNSGRFAVYLRDNGAGTVLVGVYHFDGTNRKNEITFSYVGTFCFIQWYWDGSNLYIRVNEGAWTAVAATTAASLGTNQYRVAIGRNAGWGEFANMQLLETGLKNAALTQRQFDQLYRYVRVRYERLSKGLDQTLIAERSTTDTLTTSDGIGWEIGRAFADTLTTSDQLTSGTAGTTYSQTFSDSLTLTDALAQTATFGSTLSDTATITDSLSQTATFGATFSDASTTTDTLSQSATFSSTLSDSVTLADSITQTATFGATFTDTATVSDSLSQTATFGATFSDASTTADTLSTALVYAQTFSDTIATTDSITRETSRSFADTVTVTDSLAQTATFGSTLSDAVTTTDGLTQTATFGPTLTDTATVNDALGQTASFSSSLSDTATVADTLAQTATFASSGSDTSTTTDGLTQTVTFERLPSDTATTTDTTATASVYARTIADALATTDQLTYQIAGIVTGAASDVIDVTDTLTQEAVYVRPNADTATLAETFAETTTFTRSTSESVATTDSETQTATFERALSDASTATDVVGQVAWYARTSADALAVADTIVAQLYEARAFSDALTTPDSLIQETTLARAGSDTLALSDSFSATMTFDRQTTDVAAVNEVFSQVGWFDRTLVDGVGTIDSVEYERGSFFKVNVSDGASTSDLILADIFIGRMVHAKKSATITASSTRRATIETTLPKATARIERTNPGVRVKVKTVKPKG